MRVTIPDRRSRDKRVRILAHDEIILETSRDVLRAIDANPGEEYDLDDLRTKIRSAEMDVAKERAFRLLGYRERTRMELHARLEREGISVEAITDVLTRLEEIGALSDERCAACYTRSKMIAGWGRRRIEQELVSKGVNDEVRHRVLDEFVPVDGEVARARHLIESQSIDSASDRNRVIARLSRKGYVSGDIFAALRARDDHGR